MRILITGKPAWFEKDSHNAISFYRIAYPLKELMRKNKEISVLESTGGYMPELAGIDVIFVHTPTSHNAIKAIASAKAFGKKVWLDFDDLVFANKIPKANIAWTFFNTQENQKAIGIAVSHADAISVSTKMIKERIVETFRINPNKIHVIPNALPDEMWHSRKEYKPSPKASPKSPAKIMWRGSVTHEGDLFKFRRGIKEDPSLSYHFHGHKPWVIDKEYDGPLEKYSYRKWDKSLDEYFAALHECGAHYFMVPLEYNDFNRAKSNIAWLEATYAGAACIASALDEFKSAPCITFETPKQLEKILKTIAGGEDLRFAKYAESRAEIESKYLLSITNQKRLDILRSL